jgi:hypothetical protein
MIKHERRRIFLYAINKKDFLITDITDDIIESDQDRWLEILVDEGICPKRLLFLSMEKESSLKCFEMLIGRMDFYKLDFIEIIRACGKSVLFTKHFLYALRLFWEENDIPPRKLNKLIIYISKYRTRTIRTILDDKDERSILHILTPYQREILINKREFFRL